MINETLLQKLVDRELTPEQRQSFVQSLGGQQWKTVALAFIENQILDEQIPQIAEDLNRPVKTWMTPSPAKPTVESQNRHHGIWARMLAVAVIGIICAATGYALATWALPTSDVVATKPVANQETETLLSLDEALARCAMPIPENFRLDMLEAGYVVTEAEKLSDVSLPFGGTVKIPVRKVRVEYHGIDTYQ